ncbi:MAG: hypothetical protein INR62_05690 [Rhodospirillales bacterium]|nr:hypothetical protein [Acetobacter sp.]
MNMQKTALYAALLAVGLTSTLRAEPTDDKRAKVKAMMKDRETAHMAFDEMLKDKENKRYMAKVLAQDKEFRAFYGAEIGVDAPHQERNPSQHPELFRSKQ